MEDNVCTERDTETPWHNTSNIILRVPLGSLCPKPAKACTSSSKSIYLFCLEFATEWLGKKISPI